MTNRELNKTIIIILAAIFVGFLINSFITKSALKEIQHKIEETSNDLKKVSLNVGQVINSLENSTNNIDTILSSIENSKVLLKELSSKTGALTQNEKNKIAKSISDLEKTKNDIESDKNEAKEMIEILNKTISDE
jgi:DNA repair ATPase RecN